MYALFNDSVTLMILIESRQNCDITSSSGSSHYSYYKYITDTLHSLYIKIKKPA